jgi:putative addiction module antidote
MNKPLNLGAVKVTTVGNSVGITLPKEVLARLRVGKGDFLYLTETPGGVMLTPYDARFVEVMEAAETVMREDRDVLRVLAK